MKFLRPILFVSVSVVASSAVAQSGGLSIGVRAGMSTFVGRELKDIFGTRVSYGFTPYRANVQGNSAIGTDVNVDYANENGSRMLLIPVTVGIGSSFGDKGGSFVPYFAVRGGAAYMDYRLARNGTSISERKVVPTANGEVGLILERNLRLAARYDWYGRTQGFNFDSFTISATYRIARF